MTTMSAEYASSGGGYPVEIDVDGPQPQNRLSVLLRIIFAIPHFIVLGILNYAVQITGFIAWLIIVITGKCPGGLWKFHAGYVRWQARSYGYMGLLTDKYPPFSFDNDSSYPIRVAFKEELENRNRLTVLIRILMLIPHFIVMMVLAVVAYVLAIVAWIIALFTGSVPEGIHNFIAGTLRWGTRANAYFLLLTDEYPPFSLN